MLMLLFLGLHNSSLGLSWLLDRSPMTVFKALRKLMLKLNAGLKSRNNSVCIKHLCRESRRRAFRRRGRSSWIHDKPAVFILDGRGGGEDYIPSINVEAEAAIKIVGRRILKNSTIYTDSFKSYSGLSRLSYIHEYLKHSEGEWVRGECHINSCENRASILR